MEKASAGRESRWRSQWEMIAFPAAEKSQQLFASRRFLCTLCWQCIYPWLFELGTYCCQSWARTSRDFDARVLWPGSPIISALWSLSSVDTLPAKAALRGAEDADVCPPCWPAPPALTAQVRFSNCKDVKKANKTQATSSSSLIQCRTNEVGGDFTLGRGDDAWQRVCAPCRACRPLLLEVCFAVSSGG